MNSALRRLDVKHSVAEKQRDSIDTSPMTGAARNKFEATLHAQVRGSHQLVLRILLDRAAGKAECWPGNRRIAEIAGLAARNVQLILRSLESAEIVRCVVDRSLPTQRRIVILDHPNAVAVLVRLGCRPWLQSGAQPAAPSKAENVHLGAQKDVHLGAHSAVHAGAQSAAPEFSSTNSETRIPGFSRPRERRKPTTPAEQVAKLNAWIAAAPRERT